MTPAVAPIAELDTDRIQALLDRLDPHLDGTCTVPGCLHLHGASAPRLEPEISSLAA